MHFWGRLAIVAMSIAIVSPSCDTDHLPETRPSRVIEVPDDHATIQSAINAAADGDTVLVAPGVYVGAGNRDIHFPGKAIVVMSEAGSHETIIDCGGSAKQSHRGFVFAGGGCSGSKLEGFAIQNGYVAGDREEGFGGAIVCTDRSSPTISRCRIAGNCAASIGGGVFCSGGAAPIIVDCEITENVAGKEGGGVYCKNAAPLIENCRISHNFAELHGGGVFSLESRPELRNCTVVRNAIGGGDGGGMCFWDLSRPKITNCLVSDNSSEALGGGLFFEESPGSVTSCTIANNAAKFSGGGIYSRKQSSPVVTNCIVWGNAPDAIYLRSDGIVVTYSDIERGWTGRGNISADPLFVGIGDYHLSSDSPCIDAGIGTKVHDDIDGDVRPWDHPQHLNRYSPYDMGSDEYVE